LMNFRTILVAVSCNCGAMMAQDSPQIVQEGTLIEPTMHDHPVIEILLAVFTSILAVGALAAWVLRDVIQYFPELFKIRFFV
jgi:hypothetical protein